jgi:beta-glucosidase
MAKQGGWAWPGAVEAFERFTRRAYREIAPGVRDWVTINEPMVQLLGGYAAGVAPPGIKDIRQVVAPMKGMIRGHAAAYRALHAEAARLGREVRVGIAHHLRVMQPDSPFNPFLSYLARAADQAFNWSFGEACEHGRLRLSVPGVMSLDVPMPEAAHTQDFIGVNYYSRDMVEITRSSPLALDRLVYEGSPVNDMGWEIYPLGFYIVLKEAARRFPGHPILVTENGIADSRDRQRADFLRTHVAAMKRAIAEGVPVETYCHWSSMDNFEWVEGFFGRFGLYEVDFNTQRRTARPSAKVFSKMAREGRP